VPVFLFEFFHHRYNNAITIFVIAGVSDLLDGFIARQFNLKSRLGSMLDPLADKILMTSSLLALSGQNMLPWIYTQLVVGRDFLILLGVVILHQMKIRLYFTPTLTSKCATFSQLSVLTLTLVRLWLNYNEIFGKEVMQRIFDFIFLPLVLISGVLTLVTCFQYGLLGYRFYRYGERLP